MLFYWRVQQDLNCLGEIIHFHDPTLMRSMRQWVKKNMSGLLAAEGFILNEDVLSVSLN